MCSSDLDQARFHPLRALFGDRDGFTHRGADVFEDLSRAVRRLDRLIGERANLARDHRERAAVLARAQGDTYRIEVLQTVPDEARPESCGKAFGNPPSQHVVAIERAGA